MSATTKEFLAVLAVLGILALAITMSHSDEQESATAYCENVAMWEASGLPKIERPGHPNYKNVECE